RAAGETVSGFHSGRFAHRAPLRRHRARPSDLAQTRAHDGWRRDGDERAGQGLSIYGSPAGRHGCALTKLHDPAARSESTAHMNEWDFPHIGELELPPGGFRSKSFEFDALAFNLPARVSVGLKLQRKLQRRRQ